MDRRAEAQPDGPRHARIESSSISSVQGAPVAWRFDAVVVDPATFCVVVNGEPQALEPKTFRLLQFLIEPRDCVVSKEKIFQAVWTGTFVSDNALTRAVAQIRQAIGDDHRNPRYIETIPTVGYRFVAQVEESAPALPAPVPGVPRRRVGSTALLVGAAVILVAGTLAVWAWRRQAVDSTDRGSASFLPVQFSSSSGLDVGASFSPDGGLVAYASDKTGAFEIFVKSLDAGARELQLTNDGNQSLSPAFSPDGRWVAFASMRRRRIFRVPAIGGPVQRLTDFGVQQHGRRGANERGARPESSSRHPRAESSGLTARVPEESRAPPKYRDRRSRARRDNSHPPGDP